MIRKTIRADYGETVKVDNNWTAETEKRGTTITGSTWNWYGAGTLGTQTLATPLTSVLLTPQCTGLLRNTVTLANGETLVIERSVVVTYLRQMGGV